MLHEEVELRWDELQTVVQDFQLLEQLRSTLVVGVSWLKFMSIIHNGGLINETDFRFFDLLKGVTTFIGSRPRTREVLQRRMYTHEIYEWLAEAEIEEKRIGSGPIDTFEGLDSGDILLRNDHVILNGETLSPHRQNGVSSPTS